MRMSSDAMSEARTWDGWLAREHNRLDARLAGVFIQSIWGAASDTRRELSTYRGELQAHLKDAERRFFAGLESLDERTVAMERLEWKAHVRDLQQVLSQVERELRSSSRTVYETFATLRRGLRRHRAHEDRLLQLVSLPRRARTPERPPRPVPQEVEEWAGCLL